MGLQLQRDNHRDNANHRDDHDMMQHLRYDIHPPELRPYVEPFYIFASQMMRLLPPGTEKTACIRKLLEAKDSAIRAVATIPPCPVAGCRQPSHYPPDWDGGWPLRRYGDAGAARP
jgi:hypothetical protein